MPQDRLPVSNFYQVIYLSYPLADLRAIDSGQYFTVYTLCAFRGNNLLPAKTGFTEQVSFS